MSYIGKTPTVGNFQICDAISVVNNQAAYTMQVGGVNVSPESANHMIVSLNGVIQKPTDAFTVSGSTITFASNLVTGDVINFIQILGNVLDLGVPSDATVSTAKLASTSVTAAKLNADIISGTTALTAEPADTDEFLVSDAGVLKRIDYSLIKGGGITVADQWRLTASKNTSSSISDISANLEQIDTAGQGTLGNAMTESSGVFTFPSTGIYLVISNATYKNVSNNNANYVEVAHLVTTDNSNFVTTSHGYGYFNSLSATLYNTVTGMDMIDVTNTSNVKIKFAAVSQQNAALEGASGDTYTSFTFIRLGDT